MKKFLSILLILAMVLCFAACGGDEPAADEGGQTDGQQQEQQGADAPDPGEEQPDAAEQQNIQQPVQDEKFQQVAASIGLPGLELPEGCSYEQAFMVTYAGINMKNVYGITSDTHKEFIQSVWELCEQLSPEGIYKAEETDGVCTIAETYTAVTGVREDFETAELSSYELRWNYTYEGTVKHIRIIGDSNLVSVYTCDVGTLAEGAGGEGPDAAGEIGSGVPEDWPKNDYTALIPVPDEGGKVLSSGEIGTLFAIELKWSMEQGIAYAQKLADAGFGEDCAEKYEQQGYIDRTANGINVQLMDVFGTASLTIMPVE